MCVYAQSSKNIRLCVHVCMCVCTYTHTHIHTNSNTHIFEQICLYSSKTIEYGVATISRLLKIIGLFCSPIQETMFCKETYKFKEPTNRSHPISEYLLEYKHIWSNTYLLVFTARCAWQNVTRQQRGCHF